MINQFFATKLATTQIFDDQGNRLVAAQLKIQPLTVCQIKSLAKDGYWAIQVKFPRTAKTFTRREIRLNQASTFKLGDQINCQDILKPGDLIKATGFSKGRGFAGVMKRHGFKGGPKTHGQSDRPRSPGSIGMRTTPGRVWKGKRMAGHYGMAAKTIRNLQILNFDDQTQTLLISGTIPGSRHTLIALTKTGQAKKPFKLTTSQDAGL